MRYLAHTTWEMELATAEVRERLGIEENWGNCGDPGMELVTQGGRGGT